MVWFGLYKREFLSFFNNYSAYFIMGIYAVLSMLSAFFFGVYFYADNPAMLSFFAFQPQVMAVIVPAVTMRSWSDEYKSGTIETLMTFPLKTATLVTTKFFACWSFSVLFLLFSVPLLLTTISQVEVDYLNILSSYLGTTLMLGLFSAIGCVVSAMSSIPVAAYLVTVLITWLIIGFNFSPIVSAIADKVPHSTVYFESSLNFSAQYRSFIEGQLGVDSVVYFVSFMIVLLLFNVAVVEAGRRR